MLCRRRDAWKHHENFLCSELLGSEYKLRNYGADFDVNWLWSDYKLCLRRFCMVDWLYVLDRILPNVVVVLTVPVGIIGLVRQLIISNEAVKMLFVCLSVPSEISFHIKSIISGDVWKASKSFDWLGVQILVLHPWTSHSQRLLSPAHLPLENLHLLLMFLHADEYIAN